MFCEVVKRHLAPAADRAQNRFRDPGAQNNLINLNKSNKKNDQIKPIFIVGVPRCGSTLIEKIIASGSKYITIGEETSILDVFMRQKIQTTLFY